jgi:hypothetical protein
MRRIDWRAQVGFAKHVVHPLHELHDRLGAYSVPAVKGHTDNGQGFVFGAFVPYVAAAACHDSHLSTIWRTSLGIGVVFPLSLFIIRLFLKEPQEFQRNSMKYVKTPYALVLRFYGFRLFVVSLIWFIYDVSRPPFTTCQSS